MGKILHGNFNNKIKLRKKTVAIIAAGGKGTRMGLDFNKIFLTIENKPVLAHTLDVFENSDCIDSIILVCSNNDMPICKEIVQQFGFAKIKSVVEGGSTRQESVRKGLNAISSPCDVVVVHDAARPLVTEEMLEKTIDEAYKTGAASVGVTPVDTVKNVCGNTILETVDRNSLILIQTPQAFKHDILVTAHENARKNHQLVTDDCALCELINQKVTVVQGSKSNIKLTTPEDYALISAYIKCSRNGDEHND